jgi:toxin ParE1/3/4
MFILHEEVQADLERVSLYIFEEWSFEQANRYIRLIMDEVDFICLNPESGIDFSAVRKGYFKARAQSHFIFYRINSSKNELEVIRILHQRKDIDNRLKG